MKFAARLVVIASGVLAMAIVWGAPGAATTPAPTAIHDAATLPAPDLTGRLARPRFETPPLDPEADIQSCAVCRLAAATTARLPNDAFRIESEMIERGATLRLLSSDPSVRDALWRATLVRGQVLAALRSGSGVHLCTWCRERREMLTELDISARRIPEGVMLVYTSPSPAIVRQIQAAVRAGSDVPL